MFSQLGLLQELLVQFFPILPHDLLQFGHLLRQPRYLLLVAIDQSLYISTVQLSHLHLQKLKLLLVASLHLLEFLLKVLNELAVRSSERASSFPESCYLLAQPLDLNVLQLIKF